MTTPMLTDTATIRDIIFDGVHGEPVDALAKSLREQGALGRTGVSAALRGAVVKQLAREVSDLLGMDLGDLAIAGWNRYERLRDAARRTHDAPTRTEFVEMVKHQITSSHRPSIEVLIDGRPGPTIHLGVDAIFEMQAVVAVVKNGELTAIDSGKCTVTATLTVEGAVIAKKQRQFDLPGAIRLRDGVPLLGRQRGPAG
jgi:hypothetical protein